MASVILERLRGRGRSWDVNSMCNGVLAGLVSVTAGCATVRAWGTHTVHYTHTVRLPCSVLPC